MNKKSLMIRITMHPGEILSKDDFPAPGLDVRSAAQIFEVSEEHLQSILDQKAPVTKELSRKLGEFFKYSPEFWENLQNAHDISVRQIQKSGHATNKSGAGTLPSRHR